MGRIVVPIDSDLDSALTGRLGEGGVTGIQSIRSAVGAAKTAVDRAQEELSRKREARLSHLLEKATFSDGFVQAQAALIQGSSSADTRALVGSINSPFLADEYTAQDRAAIESGAVSTLLTSDGYYSLHANTSSNVKSPGKGTVKSILEDYLGTCPMLSSASSTPAQKQDELARNPQCIFKRHVVIEFNGLEVIYGNMESISVNVGDAVTDTTSLGTSSEVYFAGRKVGENKLIDNFLLYIESIVADAVPAESASSSYRISDATPYGPHWKQTRPGGLPENVRKCSARGEAAAIIEPHLSSVSEDQLFKDVVKAFNHVLTAGGYVSMPATGFDVRCSVDELVLDGTECFIDTGPFPRGSSFTIVAASTRSSRESYLSNWGAFQFSLSDWRALHSGASFLGYTHSYTATGSTPWEATEADEILSPIKLIWGIWQELSEANTLYKSLISLASLTSIDAMSALSSGISASSGGDLNAKCKEAWEGLSNGDLKGHKSFIENTVIHSRTSVSSKVPAITAGLSSEDKPELEYKASEGWQTTAPHSWQDFPAYAIGSGNSTKSYSVVRIGTPHVDSFSAAHRRILELGGRFTSSGGRRALSASRRTRGMSMHTIGRAFDLGITTGLVVDPNSNDPESCYLVIADDRSDVRTTYTVWAKVFPEEGNLDAIQEARESGVIVNRTFDVDIYSTRWPQVTDKRIVQWTGEAFNMTQIFEDNGYVRIRPISDYYEGNSYMGIEWWHYETREGLVEGVTRVEEEVQKYYTYEQAAVNPRTRHPNFESVKGGIWTGTYFR